MKKNGYEKEDILDYTSINPEALPPKEKIFPRGFKVNRFDEFPDGVIMEVGLIGGYSHMNQVRCPVCGSPVVRERGSEKRVIKDLPYLGRQFLWELNMTEYQCMGTCGRESFVPELPGLLEKGAKMTVRMKDFIVMLAACTSGEAASRIFDYMFTSVSGDTVMRTLMEYRFKGDQSVWNVSRGFRKSAISRCSDEQIEELAQSLAYYMTPEILSIDADVRLEAMTGLFETVFVKGMRAPAYRYVAPPNPWMTFSWKNG